MTVSQIVRASRSMRLNKCLNWRRFSDSIAVDIPTRHSLKQPPRVCTDPMELQEETQRILETPIGELYASQATAKAGRDEAYDVAYNTIQRVEYLQFGHASAIPGSLYYAEDTPSLEATSEDPVMASMEPLMERMEKEGEMYMKLRHEKRLATIGNSNDFTPGPAETDFSTDEEGYLASSEEESDSSDDDDDSDDDTRSSSLSKRSIKIASLDFSPPGATVKMHEALLDAMACIGKAAPVEYFQAAQTVLEANDLDKGNNLYTLPSHVTYNAALRGIAKSDLPNEQIRDEAISSAFTLYNQLTHSLHLPRNTMTIVYMLQIIDKVFPTSRVKGNISLTLWDHATRLGVVNDEVIAAMKHVHEPSNGPEFDMFLKEISGNLPQKYRRFIHKYRHSDKY